MEIEINVWDRLPEETNKAFEAFLAYRNLGPGRTLSEAAKTLSKTLQSLQRWNKKHRWEERAQKWDVHVDKSIQLAYKEKVSEQFAELLDDVYTIRKAAKDRIDRFIREVEENPAVIEKISLKEAFNLLHFTGKELRETLNTQQALLPEPAPPVIDDYSNLTIEEKLSLVSLFESIPGKEEEIKRLRTLVYQQSYYHFFTDFWGETETKSLADNWHIKYICGLLQDLAVDIFEGNDYKHNLIINISPGETKSRLVTVFFPVWLWLTDPQIGVLSGSYSGDLAMDMATLSRDVIRTEKFQDFFGHLFEVREDLDNKKKYKNTAGGSREITSVGGTATGKHADVIIIDDPLKVDEAESDDLREKTNRWLTKTLSSRKRDVRKAPTILIMQRLHKEDPTAYLAERWGKQEKLFWVKLPSDNRGEILPAELEKFYTQDGEYKVMNPYRKPTAVIKEMTIDLGTSTAAGQLLQEPGDPEGDIFKRQWLTQRFYLKELERHAYERGKKIVWNAVMDGAYTDEKKNSASGVLIYTTYQGKLYLRAYKKFWLTLPNLIKEVPEYCRLNGMENSGIMYVEAKASGLDMINTVRELGSLSISADKPPRGTSKLSKVARAKAVSAYVEGMGVYLLRGADWGEFIDDVSLFPKIKHTDLVDCFVMAINKIRKRPSYKGFREINKQLLEG